MPQPRKPTALKVLHGDRKDRINTDEPLPAGEVVKPSWLTPYASHLWDSLAPDMIRKRVLTTWDADLFASVCEHYSTWRRAQEIVVENGVLVAGFGGVMVKNPAVQVARDAWQAFNAGAGKFGMSPADRSKVQVGDAKKRKPGEDLLSG